jgi:hypothetical protein
MDIIDKMGLKLKTESRRADLLRNATSLSTETVYDTTCLGSADGSRKAYVRVFPRGLWI